jgi:glutaredoxin-dependent peroxiredoxin
MSLKPGDKAPEFTSKTHSMEDFTLSSSIGKENVVIIFFPLVNTGVCFNEMCTLRDSLHDYDKLNAKVIAISVDSPFAQKLWVEKEGFNFIFVSDFNKEISKKYECQYEELIGLKGVAKRSAFVVDKQGILRYTWVSEDSGVLPDFKAIQKVLAGL